MGYKVRLVDNLTERAEDYYKATDGNVRILALGLLGWAEHQPTGIWETLG